MRRRLFIVGTLHAGFTEPKQLLALLESLTLSQLLVEMVEADVRRNRVSKYSAEMVAALKWARGKKIPVAGFDCRLSVLKKGMTQEDNRKVIRSQARCIRKSSWKAFNKPDQLKKLENQEYLDLIDLKKFRTRERRMVRNIRRRICGTGHVAIVTGCSHLPFFKKSFKGSSIPLAKQR